MIQFGVSSIGLLFDSVWVVLRFRTHLQKYYRPAVQRGSLLQGSCGGGGGNRMTVLEAVHNYNQFVRPVQLQVERLRREEMMLRILRGRNLGILGGVLKYERPSRGEYRGKGTGVFIPRPVPSNIGIAAPTTITRTRED